MKRSEINRAYDEATRSFARHHWSLPPRARWDITDFSLGDFVRFGLVMVTLTEEPEYGEKLMFARRGQITPCHAHEQKKADLICRVGELSLRIWPDRPGSAAAALAAFAVTVDGEPFFVTPGQLFVLGPGSRVTLPAGVWHEFFPTSEECILGEVASANAGRHDHRFLDPAVGLFSPIEEDEPARVRLAAE